MKERPILFSGPMVRALLDGSKTQTRRVISQQPTDGWAFDVPPRFGRITSSHSKKGRFGAFIRFGVGTDFPQFDLIPCPYGMPGDRLYVRETHEVRVVGTELFHGDRCVKGIRHYAKVAYRADDGRAEVDIDEATFERLDETESKGWAPSIHMPRWASRITLEVAGVRVERLQDISETDAIAEGIGKTPSGFWSTYGRSGVDGTYSPRSSFHCLWDSINGPESWDANPWVWVVEFRRV